MLGLLLPLSVPIFIFSHRRSQSTAHHRLLPQSMKTTTPPIFAIDEVKICFQQLMRCVYSIRAKPSYVPLRLLKL
ncbi:hypothetical protein L1987_15593 [Smallanthus sonchifolius]|uniref:Uncharacterized protein n=1 Tax=Smallanthus sonchifolius TaxID=185202 RepID=A0ACB9J6I9_9ASTR|nr:hypothetical protein L1987_15593 [Smallanthus sonchifolius]